MREIKFRGKRIDDGEWIYGDLFSNIAGQTFIREIRAICYADEGPSEEQHDYEIDPKTIGEFAGLHDSKGREVYEGDILSIPHGWSGYYEEKAHLANIEWDDGDMRFYFSHPDDVNIRECEIIGNIHENPTMIDYEIEKARLDKQYPTR
jgi:uncharacterized phage protein (TIGR01671 family)